MAEPESPSTILAPRIIIADDNDISLMILADGLKGLGFSTVACKNAKDAVIASLRQPPETLLLDDGMPGLDSAKAIKLVRVMEPIRAVPVILLAESPDKNTVVRAIQMGANDCVSKDSSLHDISLRIQRLIKMPPKPISPLFDNLRYFFHADQNSLTLDVDSEITTESGKNLVELVRSLTSLMPLKVYLNMENVPAIAACGIGYLSDVKDTIQTCGGTVAISKIDLNKVLPNVRRFLEKYYQFEAPANPGGSPARA